jgi:molecular chaperone GrpE
MTESTDHSEQGDSQTVEPAAEDSGQETAAPAEQAPAAAAGPEAELATLKERHLRLAAEYDNFRKRTERERADVTLRAQADIVRALLEPLDDLQRIADFDPATNSAQSLHEGAEMVERKFLRVMESAGLETIDAQEQRFDPAMHEALTMVPAESEEQDETVAQVYRKGYRFKGILLRPAQVVVRKHNG